MLNEFQNNIKKVENDSKDIRQIQESFFDYFEKRGMSKKNTIEAFAYYDSDTGGICTYAAFANTICDLLTEEQFLKHFGFEKYVDVGGTKTYNPLLLADMVFNINLEGNINKPNFIKENGEIHIKKGNLDTNALGSTAVNFDLSKANQYLSSKGLKVEEIDKRARLYSPFENPQKSGLTGPDDVGISAERLRSVVEEALSDGFSVQFGISGGTLINVETKEVTDYTGSGHAFNVIGTCEEGFIVATYGGEYIYPYADVKIFEKTLRDGEVVPSSTVGYSVLKISEIGG